MGEVSAGSCGPEDWVTDVQGPGQTMGWTREISQRLVWSSPDCWVPQDSMASTSQLTSPGLKASVSQSSGEVQAVRPFCYLLFM